MNDLRETIFSPDLSRIFDCYPGGNDTFVFCNRRVARSSYEAVGALIRARFPHFEQGAVIERTKRGRAVVRAQMIGDGFSPNCLRSVAALVAELFCRDRNAIPFAHLDLVKVYREYMTFPLEVSGSNIPLEAAVWATGDEWQVEVELPGLSSIRIDRGVELEIDDHVCQCDVVRMAGIVQVLIPEDMIPFDGSRVSLFRRVVAVRKQLKLESCKVFELAWWRHGEAGSDIFIQPVSYTSLLDSCTDQSGSGASAVAAALALDDGYSRAAKRIQQPSGVELRVRVQHPVHTDQAPRVFLTGPVKVRGELNSSYSEPIPRKLYVVR